MSYKCTLTPALSPRRGEEDRHRFSLWSRWNQKIGRGLSLNLNSVVTVLENGDGATAVGFKESWATSPKVASLARQPWAGGRIPFRIGRTSRRETNIRTGSWSQCMRKFERGLSMSLRANAKGAGFFTVRFFRRAGCSTAGKMPATTGGGGFGRPVSTHTSCDGFRKNSLYAVI